MNLMELVDKSPVYVSTSVCITQPLSKKSPFLCHPIARMCNG